MLRVVAHKSAAAALQYYTEALSRGDYYAEGHDAFELWHGKAAARLGLSGHVTKEAFAALLNNRHPETGAQLTPRMKAERRVGYDLNFHPPKSLSIIHALGGDERIVGAVRSAMAETMAEIEALCATRIRRGGEQGERITGNLAWAEFVHYTARPVGGIPDPLLHVHAFTFNLTHDEVEDRWKAVSWAGIKKDAPYSQALFHSRLAEAIVKLGYGVERTPTGWEIQGIPRTLIDKFSRRTAQIERLAKAKGITDPKELDGLGATTREKKQRGLTQADLRAAWESWLTPEEKVLIDKVSKSRQPAILSTPISPAMAFDEACEKCFAKDSVVDSRRLVAEALRFGVGSLTPERAWREFSRREMVTREVDGGLLCTSLDVLAEEVALINLVRGAKNSVAPLISGNLAFFDRELSAEQKAAVRHVLQSNDQVTGVRGVAGAGKSRLMSEVAAQIEAGGGRLFAFAPSASASREKLREDGFANAETVAHLLTNKKLQQEIRGKVIWIDEAGTVGVRDMLEIMRIAGTSTTVILTGDTAQHAPVPRGDGLRLLQDYAGLSVVELTEIRRQDDAIYRKAVAALSKGDMRTGFRRLDELGAIIEVMDDAERYRTLAQDFLTLSRGGSVPLVVSPTHAEGAKVTDAIRQAKADSGLLGPERAFIQFHNLRWEEPDRRRPENYREGLVVQFHQNAQGIQRSALFRVTEIDAAGSVRVVSPQGHEITLPLKEASRFQVFEERQINLAKGDRIRITQGGKSEDGRRLNNGNLFTIKKIGKDCQLTLNTGAVLSAAHGHLTHGYCQTSHSAQGRTVRHVLVAQSADSFFSSSREQFYVSVSRGKESLRIYTDDRRELEQAVGYSSTRRSGIELAGLTPQEIGRMSEEVNGRQWQDLIQSRRGNGAAKAHVQNLLRERKQGGLAKPANMDFRQYIAMRRGMSGPDGKNRSKGHPSQPGQKKQDPAARRRSFVRPTQLTDTTRAKIATAKQGKQPAKTKTALSPRVKQAAKSYDAAKKNLGQIAKRSKAAAQAFKPGKRPKLSPKMTNEKLAARRVKKRNTDSVKAKAKPKTKTQQKAPTPPPPARRR